MMKSILISVSFIALGLQAFARPAINTQPYKFSGRVQGDGGRSNQANGIDGTKVECVDTEGGYNQVRKISKTKVNDGTARVSLTPHQAEAYLNGLADMDPKAVVTVTEWGAGKNGEIKQTPVDYFACNKITTQKAYDFFDKNPEYDPLNVSCSDKNRQFKDLAVISGDLGRDVVLLKNSPFEAVGDLDLRSNDLIDSELKSLIKRVMPVYSSSGKMGSGFIAGESCELFLTAKHNIYHRGNGGVRDKSFVMGSPNSPNKLLDVQDSIGSWDVADEGEVFKLTNRAPMLNCRKTKYLLTHEIEENLGSLKDCKLVGFPNLVGKFGGKTKSLGKSVLKINNKDYHDAGKRAMSSCSIIDVIDNGEIIHNCSSSPGASGGPIFCKFRGAWHYVATNDGDRCVVEGKRGAPSECYNPNKLSKFKYSPNSPNAVFGRAGSFKTYPK